MILKDLMQGCLLVFYIYCLNNSEFKEILSFQYKKDKILLEIL